MMSAYELKTYRRVAGDPLRQEAIVCFGMPNDDAARVEAAARTRNLSPDRVAVLYDATQTQLASYEGPPD